MHFRYLKNKYNMQLIYSRIPTIILYLRTIRLKNIIQISISNVSGASQYLLQLIQRLLLNDNLKYNYSINII